MEISEEIRRELLTFQRNEITEHYIYKRLAAKTKSQENRQVLEKIAADELRHYQGWKKYTWVDIEPNQRVVSLYYWISRIFGITFGIQLMERGEENAKSSYGRLKSKLGVEDIQNYIDDEHDHEDALVQMIDEEFLHYVGSIVLGLNDALVELTGALAGLTLAFQNTQLIALSGAITGVAAALSMAASEYLSTSAEETSRDPLKASIYTGIAYILTVIVLIMPYLLIDNYILDLVLVLIFAVVIIAIFNYYISTVRGVGFRRQFLQMAGVSLGVAAFSFLIGYLFRMLLGVEI
jgi:VIT1/CCC1 family predicted Fe2+/Mn2+ transporter